MSISHNLPNFSECIQRLDLDRRLWRPVARRCFFGDGDNGTTTGRRTGLWLCRGAEQTVPQFWAGPGLSGCGYAELWFANGPIVRHWAPLLLPLPPIGAPNAAVLTIRCENSRRVDDDELLSRLSGRCFCWQPHNWFVGGRRGSSSIRFYQGTH